MLTAALFVLNFRALKLYENGNYNNDLVIKPFSTYIYTVDASDQYLELK